MDFVVLVFAGSYLKSAAAMWVCVCFVPGRWHVQGGLGVLRQLQVWGSCGVCVSGLPVFPRGVFELCSDMPKASLGALQCKTRAVGASPAQEWGDMRWVLAPGVSECDLGSRAGHCPHGLICMVQPNKTLSLRPRDKESDCNGKAQTISCRAGCGEGGFGCARVWGCPGIMDLPEMSCAEHPRQRCSQRGSFGFVPGRTPCLLQKHLG